MAGFGSSVEEAGLSRGEFALSVQLEVILTAGGSPGSSSSNEA